MLTAGFYIRSFFLDIIRNDRCKINYLAREKTLNYLAREKNHTHLGETPFQKSFYAFKL